MLFREEHEDVDRDDQDKEANGNHFRPSCQERVDRTGLVLRKERIRAAGDSADVLLMAFLQDYNHRNRDGKQQKDDAKDNLDSWHKAPPKSINIDLRTS